MILGPAKRDYRASLFAAETLSVSKAALSAVEMRRIELLSKRIQLWVDKFRICSFFNKEVGTCLLCDPDDMAPVMCRTGVSTADAPAHLLKSRTR